MQGKGKGMFITFALLFVFSAVFTVPKTASADAVIEDEDTSYDRYIALGADLKEDERAAVLAGFGITEEELSDYQVIEITNAEEHEYLDSYIDSSVIGSRALSSVMIVKTEEGSGISVSTQNISYCTSGMYCNALVTAGLTDATVKVVGPFNISGTSALVGAMKAYATMTGQDISEDTMDTALDELVTTAQLADELGDQEDAEELIAAVKQQVFADDLTDSSDIRDAVNSCANALGLDISDDTVEEIVDMMEKVAQEDIDVSAIKEQAKEIYDKLKEAGIDLDDIDTDGLMEKVGDFFSRIFEAIVDFFKNMFGGSDIIIGTRLDLTVWKE